MHAFGVVDRKPSRDSPDSYGAPSAAHNRNVDRKASRDIPDPYGTASVAHIRRSSIEQLRRLSTEQKRRSSLEGLPPSENVFETRNDGTFNLKINAEPNRVDSSNVQESILTEDELYEIKQSFDVIETLWRDISLCSEYVQTSLLATIHDNLGELGSELFRKIFMVNTKQVTQLLLLQIPH